MYDIRFKNPSSFILAGPSQSGKTTFALNLLRQIDDMFTTPQCGQNVIYYYKEWQDTLADFKAENIVHQWVNDLPSVDDFKERTLPYKDNGGSIVIIDDFAQNLNADIATIFTVLCHHYNATVILLTQNIFTKNPVFREISLNAIYIVLFKNPRDSSQISYYARQFKPGNSRPVMEAFRECTKLPHSYMLFDHHQLTPENLRMRSHIFVSQWPMKVWMVKADCPI
jgi:DNA polymerase III delta prime subunit